MAIEEVVIAIGGISIISFVLYKLIHSTYYKFLLFVARELSNEIHGLNDLPPPSLIGLINLINYLLEKKEDLGKAIEEKKNEDKYSNIYR